VASFEKAASELVGPVRHDIQDVHGTASRWWVVTNSANLYDQTDFESRDVVPTFHVGLRIEYSQSRTARVTPASTELLPGSWRRCQQAFEAHANGDETGSRSVGHSLWPGLQDRAELLVLALCAAPSYTESHTLIMIQSWKGWLR
jgi:hypothetical protein